jgi:hypothetical protein
MLGQKRLFIKIFVILLILFVPAVSFAQTGDEESVVTIKFDEIKEKKPQYEIQMKIPVFQGIRDSFYQLKLNHALAKEAKDKRIAFKTEALKAAKELKKQEQTIRPHQLFEEGELKMAGEIVSYYSETYLYQGGAHGVTTAETINFLNADQVQTLSLKDLFKEGVDYKVKLNNYIREEIEKRKEEGIPYFEGEEGFTTITDDQKFYLHNDQLVILFDQYEIAPGYVGIPNFSIPIQVIREDLADGIYAAWTKSIQ